MVLRSNIFVNGSDSSRLLFHNSRQLGLTLPCLPLKFRDMNLIPFWRYRDTIYLRNDLPFVDDQREGTLYHPPERVSTSLTLLLPPGFMILRGPPSLTAQLLSTQHTRLPHSSPTGSGMRVGYRFIALMCLFSRPDSSKCQVLPIAWRVEASNPTATLSSESNALQFIVWL